MPAAPQCFFLYITILKHVLNPPQTRLLSPNVPVLNECLVFLVTFFFAVEKGTLEVSSITHASLHVYPENTKAVYIKR